MARILEISAPRDRLIDTVFIPGANSDALKAWQHNSDQYDSWPYWVASSGAVGVYAADYSSSLIGKSSSVLDISKSLLSSLTQNDVGQRPLIFVCHSTGGVIAKSILRLATDSIEPVCTGVAHNLRAVMFLDTPHIGAMIIDLANKIGFGSAHLRSLSSKDSYFYYVSEWYKLHAPKFGIISRTYHGIDSRILSKQEASLASTPLAVVDADHSTLAKPASRQHTVCTDLRQLIDNALVRDCIGLNKYDSAEKYLDHNSSRHRIGENNHLVVFVHGLGANASEFWGSTPTAVSTHPEMRNSIVRFWGYETSMRPELWYRRLLIRLGFGRRTQSIAQLGEHLWSDLRLWMEEDNCKVVKLIGHSMGGLVVASAIAYGLGNREMQDQRLIDYIKGVALIATPLAGADLATRSAPIFRLFGRNIHIADLMANSISRKEIVTAFVHQLMNKGNIELIIFRAANDGVVMQNELTQPLEGMAFEQDVLAGAHSECVQNLEAGTSNLRKLIRWIQKCP